MRLARPNSKFYVYTFARDHSQHRITPETFLPDGGERRPAAVVSSCDTCYEPSYSCGSQGSCGRAHGPTSIDIVPRTGHSSIFLPLHFLHHLDRAGYP